MKEPSLCEDKERLMAFLYGECDEADRDLVERHLAGCTECAAELEALRGVRGALGEWREPAEVPGFRMVRDEPRVRRSFWPQVPAWAQLAAAVLVLSVGAAIANLDITFGAGGVTLRTGWQTAAASAPPAAAPADAPWRAELTALRQQLEARIEQASQTATPAETSAVPVNASLASPAPVLSDRRLQALLDEHDARQKDEFERLLARRFVDFAHDVSLQQQAEMMRVQQGLVQFQGRTSADLAQLRQVQSQVQNYLLRVAQIQDIK